MEPTKLILEIETFGAHKHYTVHTYRHGRHLHRTDWRTYEEAQRDAESLSTLFNLPIIKRGH